jgi:hypothetical protein
MTPRAGSPPEYNVAPLAASALATVFSSLAIARLDVAISATVKYFAKFSKARFIQTPWGLEKCCVAPYVQQAELGNAIIELSH